MPERIESHETHDPAARERRKARDLRQSAWWQARLQQGRCHYCGRGFPPVQLTMDHVVPVSRGGRSSPGNVVPACRACNTAKHQQTPAERILENLEREGEIQD